MKILYKPFGIVLGLVAGLLSQKLFNVVWGLFDKEEPPKPYRDPMLEKALEHLRGKLKEVGAGPAFRNNAA